jgi:hypothetical protein
MVPHEGLLRIEAHGARREATAGAAWRVLMNSQPNLSMIAQKQPASNVILTPPTYSHHARARGHPWLRWVLHANYMYVYYSSIIMVYDSTTNTLSQHVQRDLSEWPREFSHGLGRPSWCCMCHDYATGGSGHDAGWAPLRTMVHVSITCPVPLLPLFHTAPHEGEHATRHSSCELHTSTPPRTHTRVMAHGWLAVIRLTIMCGDSQSYVSTVQAHRARTAAPRRWGS